MKPYEVIEHTADIGVKAYGRDLRELFIHMAEGMFSLLVDPEEVKHASSLSVNAKSEGGWDRLLVTWLKELLYLFDTQRWVGREFRIHRLEPGLIEATLHGERLDLSRHSVGREVKAVTYCQLSVAQAPDGIWSAQVIFDI